MSSAQSNIARLAELFSGFEGAHGTHGVPVRDPNGLKWAIKTTARTLREPATLEMWQQHVDGTRPLGVIPVRTDGSCVWASIDYDKYDVNILELIGRVDSMHLPLVPCRSKSGGLHLFLFLSVPQPASAVQSALKEVAAQLGISGSEIFPKQSAILADRGDLGNWMVMPYFGQTYDGKIQTQVGLRKTGAELTLGEFLKLAESRKIDDLLVLSRKKVVKTSPGSTDEGSDFGDGPPCLQHLAKSGFPDGGRNNALFMVGLYHKRANPASWKTELEEANRRFMKPPLNSDEVQSCMRSLEKKDYEYTCSNEPMASHCHSAKCRRRKFGVTSSGDYPEISGLSVIDAEPAIWFVDVDGERIEISTDDLQRYDRFHKHCMEKLHRCYMPLKHETWLKIVAGAMVNCVVIEPPPDITLLARFTELLEDFCTNRQRGQRREDLLTGRPWEDDETRRHYFRLRDLSSFLVRENMKDLTRRQICRQIEKLGGDRMSMEFKGKTRSVWYVPTMALHPADPTEPPPVPGDKI